MSEKGTGGTVMDHDSVRPMLSAYLDGEVTPAEKALIEGHLAKCPACREELRQLRFTQQQLRQLGEVAPPPWLAEGIMARVRAEAGRSPGWRRRLVLPRAWRLPVEAAALVLLCVTGYLLYRSVSADPQALVPRVGAVRQMPESLPSVDLPTGERLETAPEAASAPSATRGEQTRPGSDQGSAVPAPVQPLPKTAVPSGTGAAARLPAEVERSHETAAPAGLPASQPEEYAAPRAAPASALRSKARDEGQDDPVRVLLLATDQQSAGAAVVAAAVELGGTLVARKETAAGEVFAIGIDGSRLGKLMARLARIGTIQTPTTTPSPREGAVTVYITVQHAEDLRR
jgi:hypothetical protein